jgi:hypothetical protein
VFAIAGTADRQARSADLAREALTAVAEPAYRSTSLDEHGRERKRKSVCGAA